ncbi:MAG: FAD-binding oxidoreductase [Neisseriaceae bacterium]
MTNFLNELKLLLSLDSILLDDNQKQVFEVDWRKKFHGNSVAVIFPKSAIEVQKVIRLCIKYNVKITPQGGNTSTCGAAVPINDTNQHIIINLSKLNKVIELDEKNSSITVEAGCTLLQIKAFVEKYNFYFPLSIASEGSCQIGGNIATNAGGINVIKYGTMRDLVLGIEAILPDGEVINQLTKLRKNNTNFDLKQLFIGSEGTLGIITKATLKLYPKPINYFTFMMELSNIEKCIHLLSKIKANNIVPAVFEIINKQTQYIYNTKFTNNPMPISGDWLILCEIEIENEDYLGIIHNILHGIIKENPSVIIANNEKERKNIWKFRENIPIAEKEFGDALKYDISLPISNIPQFITINNKNLLKYDLANNIIIFGHLGDGNLHYNLPLNHKNLSDTEINQIHELVYTDVVKLGGSISAEHGIGQLKTTWFQKFYDKNSYFLAHSIKNLIDPNNLFNPRKIFK